MVSQLDSFWHRGKRQFGNGLLHFQRERGKGRCVIIAKNNLNLILVSPTTDLHLCSLLMRQLRCPVFPSFLSFLFGCCFSFHCPSAVICPWCFLKINIYFCLSSIRHFRCEKIFTRNFRINNVIIIHHIISLARDWSERVTWRNIPQLKNGENGVIIHQIFSLARNWSKHVTCPNIPQLKLGNIRDYYIAVSQRTGNYRIQEFDWLKSILKAV